jgi:hypothetical protein
LQISQPPFNKQINILGNFSFTITDFNLQVGGIPVQVNRAYSTLQRFEKLDLTYAWSIDYQNVKLEECLKVPKLGQQIHMSPQTAPNDVVLNLKK